MIIVNILKLRVHMYHTDLLKPSPECQQLEDQKTLRNDKYNIC